MAEALEINELCDRDFRLLSIGSLIDYTSHLPYEAHSICEAQHFPAWFRDPPPALLAQTPLSVAISKDSEDAEAMETEGA